MPRLSVTSADFQKAFRHYREAALLAPVTITSQDGDSLVLMRFDEYQRLASRDRVAMKVEDLSDDAFAALVEQDLPSDLARFDDELVAPPRAR